MKILSLNSGSSSLKFQLYEMPEENVLISGVFERIGIGESFYTIKLDGEKFKTEVELKNHSEAIAILIKELLDRKIITSLDEVKGVGHRVVQGGSYFDKSVIATDDVISKIDELSSLAPLHNPAAIVGLNASKEMMPSAINVTVFDTSFHQTMPKHNYIYPVPYSWYTDYNVRRYGAHGTSHMYISNRMNEILGKTDTKLITCHIGNGASISAVVNGKCLNTSMGLTPNAGVMMGTRCGDMDATVVTYMMEQTSMTAKEMDTALNKQSGYLGVAGHSDSRDVEDGIALGDEKCILGQKIYVRKIVDFIAKYYVEMGGCDGIIFTAGVGENSILTREAILKDLEVLGIKLDKERNNVRGKETLISADDSSIPVYIIPTDEELVMARDTYAYLNE